MKVVILAGGLGTRLSEETVVKPKPMVEIGGQPMLWHIMKIYASFGFREFVIALGYKGEMIKDYFINYYRRFNNLTVKLGTGDLMVHEAETENWTVHLLDTGLNTQTGGRLLQAAEFIGKEPFMFTYGDGVGNVDLKGLLEYHKSNNKYVTVTAVRPPARFGEVILNGNLVERFEEKPQIGEGWINGGFFVVQPEAVPYISDSQTVWEREPLERLAKDGQLAAFRHPYFWQCMDTLRDVRYLDTLWTENRAPWRLW